VIHSDGALTAAELSLIPPGFCAAPAPGDRVSEPVFDGDFQIVDARIVGGKHLKCSSSADADPIEAIAFGYIGGAARIRRCAARADTARLSSRGQRLPGSERVQLNCQHFNLT